MFSNIVKQKIFAMRNRFLFLTILMAFSIACTTPEVLPLSHHRLLLLTDLSGSRKISAGFSDVFLENLEQTLKSSSDAWSLDHLPITDPYCRIERISLAPLPEPGNKWQSDFHQKQAKYKQALEERAKQIEAFIAYLPKEDTPLQPEADTYLRKALSKVAQSIENDQISTNTYVLLHTDLIDHEPGQAAQLLRTEWLDRLSPTASRVHVRLLTEQVLSDILLDDISHLQLDNVSDFIHLLQPPSYVSE